MCPHKRWHTGPPALRAPAGREPDRRPALSRGSDRALVGRRFASSHGASRLGRCSLASPSSSLLAAEAAALGAYVAVFMNTSTKASEALTMLNEGLRDRIEKLFTPLIADALNRL